MRDFEFALDRLSRITGVEITCYAGDQFWDLYQRVSYNPLRRNAELLKRMIDRAGAQDFPVIYRDEHEVYFSCIRDTSGEYDAWFLLGPVTVRRLSLFELHRFYWDYGMRGGVERPLTLLPFTQWLSVVESAALILRKKQFTDEEIVYGNQLTYLQEREEREKADREFTISDEEENHAHHTYEEERRLLACVREGRVQDALELSLRMDQNVGKMSKDDFRNWQKMLAAAVTLCTRAAIEGGLPPAEAYRVSDHYLQVAEKCKDIPSLIDCRNQAVCDLTERVKKRLDKSSISNYVAAACDYVAKHYREKIYLEEIAERLGISPSYLSRLFAREMEMRLQDYIVQVRVERAANLLAYSEESIAAIGDYVNFPTQSYFGKVFKKYKGMTPKEYRNKKKPKEYRLSARP